MGDIDRMRDELFAAAAGSRPADEFRRLFECGRLEAILPEFAQLPRLLQSRPHRYDVWEHTLAVVRSIGGILDALAEPQGCSDAVAVLLARIDRFVPELAWRSRLESATARPCRGLLVLAGLFHDIAKPRTRSVGEDGAIHFFGHDLDGAAATRERLTGLHFSQEESEWVSLVVEHHLRPLVLNGPRPLSGRVIRRFLRDTSPSAPEICLLSAADQLGKGEDPPMGGEWGRFVDRIGELIDGSFSQTIEAARPVPLIKGGELVKELEIEPGPVVGDLLDAISDGQRIGEVTTRAQAFSLARSLLPRLTAGHPPR